MAAKDGATMTKLLGGVVVQEREVKKKKHFRKISAPPWLRARLSKGDKSAPCCGLAVAEAPESGPLVTELDERQFQDKSVQCDDLSPLLHHDHQYDPTTRNRHDDCACHCRPQGPIYQTNLIVNQIPFMDDDPDERAVAAGFTRNYNPVRHRRSGRVESAPAPLPAPLFRKSNVFTNALPNEDLNVELRQRLQSLGHNSDQRSSLDYRLLQHHQSVPIPNSIEYDPSGPEARPRVTLRKPPPTYGNVTLNVQIANGQRMDTLLEDEGTRYCPVPPARKHGVTSRNTIASQSSLDHGQQSACLVLGINSEARNPLNYKMYTPFYNKRQTMPAEHFKNWPSETGPAGRYEDENDFNYRALNYYAEVANQLDRYERRSSFDAGSSQVLNAIDANSIMYRSTSENLHQEPAGGEDQPRDAELGPGAGLRVSTPDGLHSNRRTGLLTIKNRPYERSPAGRSQAQAHLLSPPQATSSTFGRWSGSIQNLFSIGNRSSASGGGGGVRSWSKSENCLTDVGQRRSAGTGGRDRSKTDRLWSDRLWFGRTGRTKNGRARRSNNFLTSGGGSFFTYKYDDEEESAWQKYFSLGMLRKMRPQKPAKPGQSKDRR